jgi:KAP family P-loop domain
LPNGRRRTKRRESSPSPGRSGDWPSPDDLIDDRALTREEDDEFRLRDVVDEVARLCATVPVPATVALYGSWGSGKSSLASLLRGRFVRNKKIAFARFDAFKYAEKPLRRHFISQLAAAFKVRDSAFSEGLYTTSRDFRLRIPPGKWWKLILFVSVALALVGVITAIASLIYAGLAEGSFGRHFINGLRFGIPGAAFAAPLLAAAIGLLGNYFTAETTVQAPSSDEQFERVFRKLVKKGQGEEEVRAPRRLHRRARPLLTAAGRQRP